MLKKISNYLSYFLLFIASIFIIIISSSINKASNVEYSFLIHGSSEWLSIEGLFVRTSNTYYLNIDNITFLEENYHAITLYYLDELRQENLILSTNQNSINIAEKIGNNEYFYGNINYILNNLYIKIESENKCENVKLRLEKRE